MASLLRMNLPQTVLWARSKPLLDDFTNKLLLDDFTIWEELIIAVGLFRVIWILSLFFLLNICIWALVLSPAGGDWSKTESECHSVESNSWQPHGLYSPWNSPGQNTGVGSCSLLQGDLPKSGIKPRSPTLQADSLPAEPPGNSTGAKEMPNS